MKFQDQQTNMKRLLTLFALLMSLSVSAQTDSVVYYAPSASDTVLAFRIDTSIIYGEGAGIDTVSSDSNFVWCYYHYSETKGDSFCYQAQFVIYDSLNNSLLPNVDMMNAGFRSSGTIKEFTISSTDAAKTPDQIRDLFILPELNAIYGSSNVTNL